MTAEFDSTPLHVTGSTLKKKARRGWWWRRGKSGGGHVLISRDGSDWREVWKAPGRVNPVVYGNGRFLVGGPGRQLYWSTDAETWTAGAKLDDRRCTHFRQGAFGNDLTANGINRVVRGGSR